jgi:hypothetical protein
LPALDIKLEKVADIWPELQALAIMERNEVKEVRANMPDWDSMTALNNVGIFQVLTARVDGRMIGYLSWLIDFDLESKGTLVVNQAAWYVEPGHPIVGVRMLDRALSEFNKAGVEFVYLHHTNNGRGSNLKRLFERKGAELSGFTYRLEMKHHV